MTVAKEAGSGHRLLRHAWFLVALTLGIAVRGVVVAAYRPALVFWDSGGYLDRAADLSFSPTRPVGYSVFLRPLVLVAGSPEQSLGLIQLAQHALGLGIAVACYVFLLRRGLPTWGATLAVLPVLLDPLQLVLEHYILSDVLFEVLLVAACLVLLWRRRPGTWAVVVTGLLVGSSALVRGAGSFLVAVFLVAVVCLRPGWWRVGAFLVAAVLPIASYAVGYHTQYGEYATSTAGPRFLYARLAPITYCKDPQLQLPRYERKLCPPRPIGQRASTNYFMWGGQRGPQYHLHAPAGMTDLQVIKDFDKRVVRSQPVGYAKAVLADTARGFVPTRTYDVPGYPARYWLFVDHYWALENARFHGSSSPKPAAFLQDYRTWVYTPGPVLGALLLLSAAAALGLGRARRSGDRVAVGLLAGTCAMTLLTGAALSGFSWRYQLPQIPLLPLAGALAIAALVRGAAPGQPAPPPPLRPLDRTAELLTRLPGPAPVRSFLGASAARGRLQVALAAVSALAVAAVVAAGAVRSGWFLPVPALVVGCGLGLLLAVVLLVARTGTAPDTASGGAPAEEPSDAQSPPRPGAPGGQRTG